MTYRELAKIIIENPEQWNSTVTLFSDYDDEYYPATDYDFMVSDNVDDNQLIICF